jgi:hypothetical protein
MKHRVERVDRTIIRKHKRVPAYVSTNVQNVRARLVNVWKILTHPAIPFVSSAEAAAYEFVILDHTHYKFSDANFFSMELHVKEKTFGFIKWMTSTSTYLVALII